jgi:hypothetical protein
MVRYYCGPVAQLGARFHGMEEVVGSIPTRSTKTSIGPAAIRVRKVEPARYSIIIKLCPFASPISYSVQMLGMIDSRCDASLSAKTSYGFSAPFALPGQELDRSRCRSQGLVNHAHAALPKHLIDGVTA